jgi:hypothetical protein
MFSNLITIAAAAATAGACWYLYSLPGKKDSNLPKPSNVFWIVFAAVAFLFIINGALGW